MKSIKLPKMKSPKEVIVKVMDTAFATAKHAQEQGVDKFVLGMLDGVATVVDKHDAFVPKSVLRFRGIEYVLTMERLPGDDTSQLKIPETAPEKK